MDITYERSDIMIKIIKYEQKNNQYKLTFDKKEPITIHEEVIINNHLLYKKEIDNELYNQLIIENKYYILYYKCLNYIKVRLRSIEEMQNYLQKQEVDKKTSTKIINDLIKNKFLDDERFTKAFINDKLNFTNMGPYKIKNELQKLGISNHIIDEELSNIDFQLIQKRINKIITKNITTNKKYHGEILKNKIYKNLINQGYDQNSIIDELNKYEF